MKANELRLGNWVTIDNSAYWPELKGIHMRVIGIKETISVNFPDSKFSISLEDSEGNTYNQLNQFIQPIPLTHSKLRKFGFVCKNNWFYKERFLLGYLTTDDNLQAEWKFGGTEGGWNLINIEYCHQLQNICYFLSGIELDFVESITPKLRQPDA